MNEAGVPAVKALHVHATRDARSHWAHVAVVAIHTLCCGVPIVASLAGLAASAALMGGVLRFHTFLHGRELWLLGISAVLVAAGWIAERRFIRRTGRAVSPLFWVSLACFAFNAAIVAGHRIGG
ncbi:MAG: hypothetical protein SGJ23_12720 [Alphaproteobacteria bacterium]|nr:hypothetical protein [Alphaproteobacteria bacterium]